jgi:hypothetical protein
MHDNEPVIPASSSVRRFRTPLVVGAVVVGFFAAGLGVAFAQTDPSTTTAPTAGATTSTTTPVQAPAAPGAPGKLFGRGHGHGPGGLFGGKLFGLGGFGHFGGLHGEFTIRKPDGNGFQTVAVQTGEVTAVSPSSITVKSEDGFSRTYSVDENTVVGSGRDGIGTVKTGDTVRVAGVVEDGKAKAAGILDTTSLGKIGEHWGFPKRK